MKQRSDTINAPSVTKNTRANARPFPSAPPAYRPLAQPIVLQTKTISIRGRANVKSCASMTPHIYRPQPVPQVLQTKNKQTAKVPDVRHSKLKWPSNLVQKSPQPFSGRHGIRINATTIQRAESPRQHVPPWEVRQGPAEAAWNTRKKAGMQVPGIEIQQGGEGEMYATVYVPLGPPLVEKGIDGEFSTGLHAEMDALQKACAQGYRLDEIQRIVIGREPCHRCSVVLNALGLAERVRYKTAGQKEYHTWGFPDLTNWGRTPAGLLNLAFPEHKSTQELIAHFARSKWW